MKTSNKRILRKSVCVLAVAVMLLGSVNLVAFAEGSVITDVNLKQALIALGKDTTPDGEITQAELEAITGSLDLSGKGINDITGLGYAKNVTELNISNNSIKDISAVSSLPLTNLNVSMNYLDITAGSGARTIIDAFIVSGTCTVTYEPQKVAVTGVTLDKTSVESLYVGEKVLLAATISPAEATEKNVLWSSDNPAVAAVNNGEVTAAAPGTAKITASSVYDNKIAAECTVTVKRHVSGVTLDKTSLEMCEGDTAQLSALVSPEDATDKTVAWASSDNEIATVANGLVTVLQVGTADITATAQDGSLKAACTVTIKPNKLSSPKYMVNNGLLTGVAKFTVMPIFKANLNNTKTDIHIYKADGTEVSGGIIGTGSVVKLFVGGKERDSLTVVVSGDADGDGGITVSDYTLARLNILGLKPLDGNLRYGADVDGDGAITIKDYTLMRLDILNMKLISTAPPDLPEVTDPRIRKFLDIALSVQGKPYVWGAEGPDSFDCSGFIYYCLNQAGYSVGRTTANTYSGKAEWQYVDRNALQPGDLMFYWSDSKPGIIGHVGIYLGNGYHIHASSDYGFIVICRVEGWYDRMLSHGRRVFF